MDTLMVQSEISSRILTLRSRQVMLDRDLAELYQVETRVLKQAIKRNIKRFPDDFMFILTDEEINKMVSQFVIPSKKHFGGALPYVFTEQGIYMLATVLKSDVAIEVNIAIIRTFQKLREFSKYYNALAKQMFEIDRKHDKRYSELKKALNELVATSMATDEKVIGFLR